jgi:hypothetical protein
MQTERRTDRQTTEHKVDMTNAVSGLFLHTVKEVHNYDVIISQEFAMVNEFLIWRVGLGTIFKP